MRLRGKVPRGLVFVLTGLLAGSAPAGADEEAGPPGDVAYGAYLASQCVTCHRDDAAADGIPPIAGLPPAYLATALSDYRSGGRDNAVMRTVARALGDAEIAALAAYFAKLPPP